MTRAWVPVLVACLGGAAMTFACSTQDDLGPELLSKEELMKPETCTSCHADHVREWSGSMHAYAAEDPVFLAMNARLQRETNGELGTFCVKCHAPLAVALGKTVDGLNLAELPAEQKGVTCYFCHNASDVTGSHNNPLVLGFDQTMRGGFANAAPGAIHGSAYSPIHDRNQIGSSSLCGSCHDIVTPGGAHIERTFAEWKASVFNQQKGATCSQCHMTGSGAPVPIATPPGDLVMPVRTKHSHTFVGVDVALTPFPEAEAQAAEVKSFLGKSLQTALCVSTFGGTSEYRVVLDNVGAGHAFPSGSPDRRVWVELRASREGVPLFESGVFADGEAAMPKTSDPNFWGLRDYVYDASGKETHLFGAATSCKTDLLPSQVTFDRLDPRFYQSNIVQRYPRDGSLVSGIPDTVTMRVRMIPIGLEVIDDLVASGDLDPALRSKMPIFDVGEPLRWTAEAAIDGFQEPGVPRFRCVTKTNVNFAADRFPAPTSPKDCPPAPAP